MLLVLVSRFNSSLSLPRLYYINTKELLTFLFRASKLLFADDQVKDSKAGETTVYDDIQVKIEENIPISGFPGISEDAEEQIALSELIF